MKLNELTLVTGNPNKVREAERIVGVPMVSESIDLPEIQSLDLAEVARAKGRAAFDRLDRPIVVEETGLELAALDGFPGPLVKWMLAAIGPDGIARAATRLGETRALARCLLYATDGVDTIVGAGVTAGRLVTPPRGGSGFGWDPVFEPDGEERTYGELPAERKDEIGHRGRAWRDLLAGLEA